MLQKGYIVFRVLEIRENWNSEAVVGPVTFPTLSTDQI